MTAKGKMLRIGVVLATIACLSATTAKAQGVRVSAGPTDIDFQPTVAHERLVLTVSAPDGCVVSQEVKAGEVASFSIFDEDGQSHGDGSYTWEVTLAPVVDEATRKMLAEVRGTSREKKALAELRRSGKLPKEPLVQSGSFAVVDGAIVVAGEEEPGANRPKARLSASGAAGGTERVGGALERVGAADQVIPDDLIVQGSTCVGFDCVNNESFGFDTIRLKENNTRIKFEDTSVGSFPTNDWQLTANDSASGGSSKFSIEDITGAKVPFTITAGASTNSIFVDSTGRVGFRTSTPVLDLHVATSNTPAVRLEQNSSGGFTAQTWDIAGNEANFFVRDVTGGSRLPFRIRPGAPTSSVDISADGDVGIGTASPDNKLDVQCNAAGAACVKVQNSNATGFSAIEYYDEAGVLGLSIGFDNAGNNARINAVNSNPLVILTDATERIRFPAPGGNFITAANGASLTAGGTWANASSRAYKTGIVDLAASEALAAIKTLDPVKFQYTSEPGEQYVGFIAEDVPDLVARNDHKSLSPMDVVAVLTKVVQEQQKTIEGLSARLADLEQEDE